jgi:hypothetical protein
MMSATCSTSSVLAASGAALSRTELLHLRAWWVLPAAAAEQQQHSRSSTAGAALSS